MPAAEHCPTNPAAFYRFLASTTRRLLMCDYDGTLAPFCVDRLAATPYPGVREILRKVGRTQGTRLVIVSGREVSQVRSLLGLEIPVEIWGCHGWQRQQLNGPVEQVPLPERAQAALHKACAEAPWPDDLLEQKPVSLAVHWRGASEPERISIEKQARELWQPLVDEGGLELHAFNGGLELRCPARTKGDVVQQMLSEACYDAVAYLGDDRTDEDAFRALKGKGLPVLVSEDCRETAAELWLVPPEALLDFLAHWHAKSED